jgi:hypothetical protein
MKRKHGHFSSLSPVILQTASSWFPVTVFLCLSALAIQASDPLFAPSLQVELGPEKTVASGAGWPYLFQSSEGTTVVLGHVKIDSPWPERRRHFLFHRCHARRTPAPSRA